MAGHGLKQVIDQFASHLDRPLNFEQQDLLGDILACKTSSLGSHTTACNGCGQIKIHYNSCGNRGCPYCQGVKKEKWVLERSADLLPVRYFHVVFTIPEGLRSLCLTNQKYGYDLLFTAAWKTLQQFASDHRNRLQAEIGSTMVLHTWTQQLAYHPHVHCIVPAGGISNGHWKDTPMKGKYLFPVKAMSKVFRGKFMEACLKALQKGELVTDMGSQYLTNWKQELYAKEWVVYAKKAFGGPKQVLEYLGRYTHRMAISNYRILEVDDQQVTFSYLDRRKATFDQQSRQMSLKGEEFLRRFLLHVLPKGYRKIRHYGFLASRIKTIRIAQARKHFGLQPAERPKYNTALVMLIAYGKDIHLCQSCLDGVVLTIEQKPRPGNTQPRSPPYLLSIQ